MFFDDEDMTTGASDAGMQDDGAMHNDDAAGSEDHAGEETPAAPAEGEESAGM